MWTTRIELTVSNYRGDAKGWFKGEYYSPLEYCSILLLKMVMYLVNLAIIISYIEKPP